MVQIEICNGVLETNLALERLQNDGFNIQDIKFAYHNHASKIMIIYSDEVRTMLDIFKNQSLAILKEGEESDVSSIYNYS